MVRFGVVSAFVTEDRSSARLLSACARLGEALAVDPAELGACLKDGGVEVSVAGRPASSFDCFLLVRGLSPGGDPDLQLELYRALERSPVTVMSRIDALLAAQDKFRTSTVLAEAGVRTPPAVVVQRASDAAPALERLGRAVAKPLFGSLGEGVELLPEGEKGLARALELLERCKALYLQRHVDHGGRDVRAFVVGGRVEAATLRLAAPGEMRTNVSLGAQVEEIRLQPDAEALALRAARALGLDWAGVDLAADEEGPTVIEVNGSPNFEGIREATGRDMAERIAAHALRRVREAAR